MWVIWKLPAFWSIDKMRMRTVVMSSFTPTLGQRSIWTIQPSWFQFYSWSGRSGWFLMVYEKTSFDLIVLITSTWTNQCIGHTAMCPVFKSDFWTKKEKRVKQLFLFTRGWAFGKKCFHWPRALPWSWGCGRRPPPPCPPPALRLSAPPPPFFCKETKT